MRYGHLALLGLLLTSSVAQSKQTAEAKQRWLALRSFTGMYVPMGEQKRDFKAARTYGFQAALDLAPYLRVVGSTSWTDGESRNFVMRQFPKMRIWQYDLGAELPSRTVATPLVDIKPFLGAGAGARNYYYPDKGMMSKLYPAAYYAVGSELQAGKIALRVEGRAYISIFHAPLEPDPFVRDDMLATFGLTYRVF